MKAINEENQEIEFISSEDFQEMSGKLFEIEQRVRDKIATDEEIQYTLDLIMNTIDYSDILGLPVDVDIMGHIHDTLSEKNETSNLISRQLKAGTKILSSRSRAVNTGLKLYKLIGMRKPFRKEIELFFDLIGKSHNLVEEYKAMLKNTVIK